MQRSDSLPPHVELLNLRSRSCEPNPENLLQIFINQFYTNLGGCHTRGHPELFFIFLHMFIASFLLLLKYTIYKT